MERRGARAGCGVARRRLAGKEQSVVLDVVFILVTVALFAILALIVRAAERL